MRITALLLLSLFLACTNKPSTQQGEEQVVSEQAERNLIFPDSIWERASPASQQVDPDVLDNALAYLASHCGDDGLEEVMVIRNGYLIWAGDSIYRVHDIWSCTKSFVSTAVGMMAAEGILALDQKVSDHAPSLAAYYPEVTYRHFLTMTSGYDAQGASRWPDQTYADWSATPYVPTRPLFAPGTAYAYWDEAMIMLGKALTQASGSTLNDFLEARLFQPIGITKRPWWGEGIAADSIPINFGGTGLRMSASEHARFGLLMLNEGNWAGKQVLPADFVRQATTNQVPVSLPVAKTGRSATDGTGRYGFNWWVINKDEDAPVAGAFTSGLNHNVCLIVPAWDMVIVRMGTDGNPELPKHEVYSEVLKRLSQGVK